MILLTSSSFWDTSRLQDCEQKLQQITKKQGANVDNLLSLVARNRTVLDGMKVHTQGIPTRKKNPFLDLYFDFSPIPFVCVCVCQSFSFLLRVFGKTAIKVQAMQQLVEIVLDSDQDRSATFDDDEIETLELRFQAVVGITVNTDLLKKRVKATDRSLSSVFTLLKEIDHAEDIHDMESASLASERIFVIDTEALKSSQ
jgi:hypothetical protein